MLEIPLWALIVIMVVAIILIVIPIVSYLIHRTIKSRANKGQKKTTPNLYITNVTNYQSSGRTSDLEQSDIETPEESKIPKIPESYDQILFCVERESIHDSQYEDLRRASFHSLDVPTLESSANSLVLSTFFEYSPSTSISDFNQTAALTLETDLSSNSSVTEVDQ